MKRPREDDDDDDYYGGGYSASASRNNARSFDSSATEFNGRSNVNFVDSQQSQAARVVAEEEEEASAKATLTDDERNALAAKILKAQMRGQAVRFYFQSLSQCSNCRAKLLL